MNKLYKIEDLVKEILEESEPAREDDFILVANVYYKIAPEIINIPFGKVMLGHKALGLPYFESIRRTRQKLQAENENLKPRKEVQDARLNETSKYINYAIDYKPTLKNLIDKED